MRDFLGDNNGAHDFILADGEDSVVAIPLTAAQAGTIKAVNGGKVLVYEDGMDPVNIELLLDSL